LRKRWAENEKEFYVKEMIKIRHWEGSTSSFGLRLTGARLRTCVRTKD